ncbi:hypothetical protein DUI87_31108 [Hirundo rustica rustica]|uniref:Uncharacterized protein n=1 Tax=Hirundo rustica rustica TaxID=333673 RepID=A0A3M0JCN5_HIRRU|nr:hypothetical protein DUI87_31108 [Hirundo rustica rustica]
MSGWSHSKSYSQWLQVEMSVRSVPQRSVLLPELLNISINDMDRGMEGTLSKLTDNTKLFGAVNTLEGMDAIQTDLGKFKGLACAKFKFSKAKCNVLYLGQSNPRHKYRLSREKIGGSYKKKDSGNCSSPAMHPSQTSKPNVSWAVSKAAWTAG